MVTSSKPWMNDPARYPQKSATSTVMNLKRWPASLLGVLLVASIALGSAQGQEQKRKVPGLSKIISGSNAQAFDGIVQSLDMKRKILTVNTVQGGDTEIFPVKKNLTVATADGDRVELTELKPGTNVLVYYDQRGDRRTVKQIIVVTRPKAAKKAPPSS